MSRKPEFEVSDTFEYTSSQQEPHQHTCNTPQDDGECLACGERDCPHHEPLHYHHDGCPACSESESPEPPREPLDPLKKQIISILNADLSPWTFDGSEPMAARIIEACQSEIERLKSSGGVPDTLK